MAFYVAARVLFVALWASGAPAAVYPLYADQPGMSTLTTTALFATYPVALVIALIGSGGVSDTRGRRETILMGLCMQAAGTGVFVVTDWMPALFVARSLQGLGVGVAMGAASAALIDLAGAAGSRRASSVNAASTASGTATALILGGFLVEYGPRPTHLPFAVLLVATGLLVGLVCLLPDTRPAAGATLLPSTPARALMTDRRLYVTGVASISVAFMTGAVILALGTQIVRALVGTENVFLGSLALSTWAVAIIPAAGLARRASAARAASIGGPLTAIGMAGISLAATSGQPVLLLLASSVSGAGYGLMFYGGLDLVTLSAPLERRARMLAGMYLAAYLGQGATAMVLGWLTGVLGLGTVVTVALPTIGAFCVLVGALTRAASAAAGQGGLGTMR